MPKGSGVKGSKLGGAISTDVETLTQRAQKDTEKGKAVNTDLQKSVAGEAGLEEPPVSLTIKVPLAYRRHWQVEAKRRGTTVTSLIVEALRDKLGLPDR